MSSPWENIFPRVSNRIINIYLNLFYFCLFYFVLSVSGFSCVIYVCMSVFFFLFCVAGESRSGARFARPTRSYRAVGLRSMHRLLIAFPLLFVLGGKNTIFMCSSTLRFVFLLCKRYLFCQSWKAIVGYCCVFLCNF